MCAAPDVLLLCVGELRGAGCVVPIRSATPGHIGHIYALSSCTSTGATQNQRSRQLGLSSRRTIVASLPLGQGVRFFPLIPILVITLLVLRLTGEAGTVYRAF